MINKTFCYSIDRCVGKALRTLRKEKGLTLRQLSFMSGKFHTYFAKIENYERRITYGELIDICKLIDVEPTTVYALAHEIENN